MPINIPNSSTEIEQRSKTDVQRQLTTSNPFLPNSWLGALINAFSNRIFDFYLQLKVLLTQTFWDTSTGDFLKRQASWFGFNVNTATKSSGNIVATGTATSNIAALTAYKTSDNIQFTTTASSTITANVVNILSINRSGDIATVITDGNHNMASNVKPNILGSDQAAYNLSNVDIQVTGLNSFTYSVSGSPTTPATGIMTLTNNSALVPVESVEFQSNDLNVNLILDSTLSLETPLGGVDSDAKVDFSGIVGGTALEEDDDFRTRFIDGVQNPTAMFNVQAIKDKCKEVSGVTRVFVREITPEIGQTTVYFVRDNDTSIIPTAPQVTAVKDKLLTIKPANTSSVDVIVEAPIENQIDFTFDALTPDTTTMRSAIEENLKQFFKESTDVGVNIDEDAYRAAIFSTVDVNAGDQNLIQVQSFSLTTPIGDIVNTTNEISTLGVVSFAII